MRITTETPCTVTVQVGRVVRKRGENRVFLFEIWGNIREWSNKTKQMHMILRILREEENGVRERLYPIHLDCKSAQQWGMSFGGKLEVLMDSLFMDYVDEQPNKPFRAEVMYLTPDLEWTSLPIDYDITDATAYPGPSDDLCDRFVNVVVYIGLTLGLPVWLFRGWLATKGIGTLMAPEGSTGKRAIFLHAHNFVKDICGFGYSIREYKTNYFKKKYEKYCKKYPKTEGILFLSERPVDVGGNLDCVRSALQRKGGYHVREYLTDRPVGKLTLKELRECAKLMAQNRVIILEDFVPQIHALHMREDTKILQLWHACGAFKLFGLSELDITGLPQRTRNHRSYNATIVSSEGMVPFYSEAFGIEQRKVKPIGIPRTDIFFDETYKSKKREDIYAKYPGWKDKKVVLFAPTFRGDGNMTAYYPHEKFPAMEIVDQLPEDVVLVVKHHPFVHSRPEIASAYEDKIFDLTGKENINDLLLVTDVLVTDYSSSIFEAALLDIPMLFYAFDLEEYLRDRDLYFDIGLFAPGKIVETRQQLVKSLQCNLLGNEPPRDLTKFKRFFLKSLDGKSTERTVKLVEDMYDGRE